MAAERKVTVVDKVFRPQTEIPVPPERHTGGGAEFSAANKGVLK
jgi:hypothetical protein